MCVYIYIYIYIYISGSILLRMRNVFNVVKKIKTHILCSFLPPQKSCPFYDNVEKYGIAGQATDDNMAHAHCWLDTWGHTICNIYCFSTATVVCKNVPQCHVIRTLPAFVIILISPPTEVWYRHNHMRIILYKVHDYKTKISAVRQYG